MSKIICGEEARESGEYGCLNCGQKLTLEKGERIPPCPRCSNQSFEKITSDNEGKFEELDRDYKNNY